MPEVERAAAGSKLKVEPISSRPRVGRARLRDRGLDASLRQARLVADHRDGRVRGHGHRRHVFSGRPGSSSDGLQVVVLAPARTSSGRSACGSPSGTAGARHATSSSARTSDASRHAAHARGPCTSIHPAQRHRHADVEEDRRDRRGSAGSPTGPAAAIARNTQRPMRHQRERQRRAAPAAARARAARRGPPTITLTIFSFAPDVVRDQLDRLEHAAVALELPGHLARGGERVERVALHDPVASSQISGAAAASARPDQRCVRSSGRGRSSTSHSQ